MHLNDLEYDLVIIGATSAALGIASEVRNRYRTLILNATSMVAYEFINAYKPGANWEKEPETEPARVLRERLVSENIIRSGNAHIYSAGPVFYKAFRALQADILLETGLVSAEEKEGGYELSVYHVGGFQTVHAGCMIDTTEREAGIRRKSLNCLLVNKEKSEPFPALSPEEALSLEGADFHPDGDEVLNSAIMKISAPAAASLQETRHKLIECWERRPKAVANWKIAAIGLCFDVTPSTGYREISKTHILLPSAWQDNPLSAVDAGVALGRSVSI